MFNLVDLYVYGLSMHSLLVVLHLFKSLMVAGCNLIEGSGYVTMYDYLFLLLYMQNLLKFVTSQLYLITIFCTKAFAFLSLF